MYGYKKDNHLPIIAGILVLILACAIFIPELNRQHSKHVESQKTVDSMIVEVDSMIKQIDGVIENDIRMKKQLDSLFPGKDGDTMFLDYSKKDTVYKWMIDTSLSMHSKIPKTKKPDFWNQGIGYGMDLYVENDDTIRQYITKIGKKTALKIISHRVNGKDYYDTVEFIHRKDIPIKKYMEPTKREPLKLDHFTNGINYDTLRLNRRMEYHDEPLNDYRVYPDYLTPTGYMKKLQDSMEALPHDSLFFHNFLFDSFRNDTASIKYLTPLDTVHLLQMLNMPINYFKKVSKK